MSKPSDVVNIALAEVGYREKASNAYLDDKTANAGAANWTKYARDLAAAGYYNGNKNGYAWCARLTELSKGSASSARPVRSGPGASFLLSTISRKAGTTEPRRSAIRCSSNPAGRSATPALWSK